MNFKVVLLLGFLIISMVAKSQSETDKLVEQIIESISENAGEDYDYTELVERLNYYTKHPLNLNRASQEQLTELTFLSSVQVHELINYRNINGEFIDMLELQAVSAIDEETVRKLMPFCSLSELSPFKNATFKRLLNDGSAELMFSYAQILQKQKGYFPGTTTNFSGSPQRFLSRYRYHYGETFSASVTMEKDPGEGFFSGAQKQGFDFYSANVSYRGRGRLSKLVVGDYSLQFGQGLTLWSGLSFGKSASVATITKNNIGLRPYSSTNELLYFRGMASTLNFNRISLTPFISVRSIDGSIGDENGVLSIVSTPVSGFHRTSNEIESRNNTTQTVYGANVQFGDRRLRIGATAYQTKFNYPMANKGDVFDFHGEKLTNLGFYYNYNLHNFYLFGESSHSLNSGFAYLNGVIASLSSKLSLIILHRNYQKNYHSFFNQAVSEGTNAVNEKGLYSGLNFTANRKIEFNIYTDFFKFPWLRFRVDAPSSGYEILSQFSYSPSKKLNTTIRYKYETKEENDAGLNTINHLVRVTKQNYRLEVNYKISGSIRMRNRAEVVKYNKSAVSESGFLLYQDVIYHPLNSRFSGNFRFALFDTPGFNSRVYAFENDMLYNYSIPAYQNKGSRFYVNGHWKLNRSIDLWCRYAVTSYVNQESIGSGPDTIDGNQKSDLKLQLRFQF